MKTKKKKNRLNAPHTQAAVLAALEDTRASASTVRLVGNILKSGGDLSAAFGAEVIGPVAVGVCWSTTSPDNPVHLTIHKKLTELGFERVLRDGGGGRYVFVRATHSTDLGASIWRQVVFFLLRELVQSKAPKVKGHPKLIGLTSWDFGASTYPAKGYPRFGFPGSEINDRGEVAPGLSLEGMLGVGMISNIGEHHILDG